MLYKIGEVYFRLLGTNGFHAKAKSERFTAASSPRRQNLKYKHFTWWFSRLRQIIAPRLFSLIQQSKSVICGLACRRQIFKLCNDII